MIGEPILVMLIEDNIDHAELVMRTLEEHRIANKVRHFLDGQSRWITFFAGGSSPTLQKRSSVPMLFCWTCVFPVWTASMS